MTETKYDFKLVCSRCGNEYDHTLLLNTCPKCGGLLEVKYDYDKLADKIRVRFEHLKEHRHLGLWDYIDLLPYPINSINIVTMGEGLGEVLFLRSLSEKYGVNIYARYYGNNPTGTFKDLGMSVAVSMAKELGIKRAITYSTGNAGTSLAAYCAKAGIPTYIIIKDRISMEKLYNIIALGAKIIQVRGLKDPWGLLNELSKRTQIYYFTNFINPFRAEGHKSLAYDIFLKLEDNVDFVIEPLGTGGGIWGSWKGFKELSQFGLISKLPRIVAVQPEAVMHAVKAFKEGKRTAEPYGDASATIVQSLADSTPLFGDERPLSVLYESKGDAVAVSDMDVVEAVLELGKYEGLFVEPAAATTLAALKTEINYGKIDRKDNVVLSLTGTGLKQPDIIEKGAKIKFDVFNPTEIDKIVKYMQLGA